MTNQGESLILIFWLKMEDFRLFLRESAFVPRVADQLMVDTSFSGMTYWVMTICGPQSGYCDTIAPWERVSWKSSPEVMRVRA